MVFCLATQSLPARSCIYTHSCSDQKQTCEYVFFLFSLQDLPSSCLIMLPAPTISCNFHILQGIQTWGTHGSKHEKCFGSNPAKHATEARQTGLLSTCLQPSPHQSRHMAGNIYSTLHEVHVHNAIHTMCMRRDTERFFLMLPIGIIVLYDESSPNL